MKEYDAVATRKHNIKLLDGMQVGDILTTLDRFIKVTEIERGDDWQKFTVWYMNDDNRMPIRNLVHVQYNISKQLRDLARL